MVKVKIMTYLNESLATLMGPWLGFEESGVVVGLVGVVRWWLGDEGIYLCRFFFRFKLMVGMGWRWD